ncbi:MAG: alpha/beta hydrolase [Algicola sp.]|nr:alpha/beta hydrolase [Algicola sp.]
MILKNQILERPDKKPIVWDAYFNRDDKPKTLVIFSHGYKGFKDWGTWNLVANEFSARQYFFVKFNFSHNGGTVENPIDFPDLQAFAENNYTKEIDDLDAILNYLLNPNFTYANQIDNSNVILIGHSRGGGISIIKTAEDPRITKLITWASICDFGKRSATTGDLEAWRNNGVKYVLNGRTKQQMPHNFQFYENYIKHKERLDIQSAIKKIKQPILIIHAKDDPSVSFSEAEELLAYNPKNNLVAIENSNHVFGSSHPWEKDTLPKALTKVLEESLHFID